LSVTMFRPLLLVLLLLSLPLSLLLFLLLLPLYLLLLLLLCIAASVLGLVWGCICLQAPILAAADVHVYMTRGETLCCLSRRLSDWMRVCGGMHGLLSVCLSVCLSVSLSVSLFVSLSVSAAAAQHVLACVWRSQHIPIIALTSLVICWLSPAHLQHKSCWLL